MEQTPNFKVKSTENYPSNDGDAYGKWIRSIDTSLSLLRTRPHDLRNHRVPNKLLSVKPEAYTPQIVSIGPYHRNKPELQAMEDVKRRYMLSFLERVSETDTETIQINESHSTATTDNSPQILALDKCYKVISQLEVRVRAFYAEDINLDKHELVEMLLVDACFILEYMRRMQYVNQEEPASYLLLVGQVTTTMMYALSKDLMLLDNQIPFIILQQLFDIIPSSRRLSGASGEMSLHEVAFRFFHPLDILRSNILPLQKPLQNDTSSHLLDMLYRFCSPSSQMSPFKMTKKWGLKRCAAELIKSGFKISLHGPRMSIVDIKFVEGEIFIPNFIADKFSSTLLRNLIALEQTRNDRHVISSYISFMGTLVRSLEDVYILEKAGIILDSKDGFQIEVSFKSLWEQVNSVDFVFRDLCEEINNFKIPVWKWRRVKGHTTITWYRWKESIKDLKRDYFKSRWSLIAFLAASFVILLAVAQTFYTIRAYYSPYN